MTPHTVYVFTRPGEWGPLFVAAIDAKPTKWTIPSPWTGPCVHNVSAPTGTEAKRRAIQAHREGCVGPPVRDGEPTR